MRRRVARGLVCASVGIAATASLGCGSSDSMGGAMGAPSDPGIPSSPTTPAPTGSKWEGIEVEGDCGRQTIEWVLVDEMCGGLDDPGYLDSLRAPIFRDGAVLGDSLFTVDATHLWVLDVAAADAPARRALVAGLDHPIAVGTHAGRLVVAAGDAGLLLLDVSTPDAPLTVAEKALPGPALDVTVDGDRALVPMGKSGVAVVDLAPTLAVPPGAPELVRTVASPGFAVGVAASGNVGHVAACDTFATVDLATGQTLGAGWLSTAYDNGVLVAPAKDVTLVGTTAFVAAGRYGAVAVDVTTPASPLVMGDCTIDDDLSFYASGVRAQAGTLYVAGGEWGILPVDVSAPGACTKLSYPTLPPLPSQDDSCNQDPPWMVMPWEDLWAPPPPAPVTPGTPVPGKDPLQTLPMGDVLYAFGDARRLGVRAVDVRSSQAPDLTKLGRYEEPRRVVDIAARGGRVLVVGPAGGLFSASDTLLLEPASGPPEIADGVAATMLGDGSFAFVTPDALHIEGKPPVTLGQPPVWHGLSARQTEIFVAHHTGLFGYAVESGFGSFESMPIAELPPALLARPDGVYVAAPEWERAIVVDVSGASQELAPNGVFDADEILDANLWREGLPRRLLADSPYGVVEIAALGSRAGLTVHGAGGASSAFALPSGTYVDSATAGDRLYLVLADRNVYRSTLLTLKLGTAGAEILESQAFTGIGMAVSVDGDRLYLADADRGVRVYSIAGPAPQALGVVELGGAP